MTKRQEVCYQVERNILVPTVLGWWKRSTCMTSFLKCERFVCIQTLREFLTFKKKTSPAHVMWRVATRDVTILYKCYVEGVKLSLLCESPFFLHRISSLLTYYHSFFTYGNNSKSGLKKEKRKQLYPHILSKGVRKMVIWEGPIGIDYFV